MDLHEELRSQAETLGIDYFGVADLAPAHDAILEQGGTVYRFIGDAIMAVFGAPVHHRDHARRAVRAALRNIEIAAGFRTWMDEHFPDRGLPEFRIGVGLHTGTVVVGTIGSTKRAEYSVTGDSVNTASRLEGLTKELKWSIVASAETVRSAGPGVGTGGRETKHVKGRDEPVEVFEILGIEDEKGEGS